MTLETLTLRGYKMNLAPLMEMRGTIRTLAPVAKPANSNIWTRRSRRSRAGCGRAWLRESSVLARNMPDLWHRLDAISLPLSLSALGGHVMQSAATAGMRTRRDIRDPSASVEGDLAARLQQRAQLGASALDAGLHPRDRNLGGVDGLARGPVLELDPRDRLNSARSGARLHLQK